MKPFFGARGVFRTLIIAGAIYALTEAQAGVHIFDSNRITVTVTNLPIRALLANLAQSGVAVQIDPRVTGNAVTLAVTNRDLEHILPDLLRDYDYVLEWDIIRGPLGNLPRLSGMQVYPRGVPKRLEPVEVVKKEAGVPATKLEFVPGEILLRLKPGTDLTAFRTLLQQINGNVVDCIPNLGIYRVRIPDSIDLRRLLEMLERHALVQRAEPNLIVEAPKPVPWVKETAGAILADAVASLPKLASNATAVAVLDTGVATNMGLDRYIIAGLDAVNPLKALSDTRGHGTQMSLLSSGAVMPDGISSSGAAAAAIIPIRTFDDQGLATSFSFLRAVDFAVVSGARVFSMSWTSEENSGFMSDTLAAAQARGIICVAAAGNEPSGKTMYPASLPGVLAVSAVDTKNTIWSQSNYGEWIDLAAPGFATFASGAAAGNYAGTSIATAFVANTIARYLAAHPKATTVETLNRLLASLSAAGDGKHDSRLGYGILDQAAVDRFLK